MLNDHYWTVSADQIPERRTSVRAGTQESAFREMILKIPYEPEEAVELDLGLKNTKQLTLRLHQDDKTLLEEWVMTYNEAELDITSEIFSFTFMPIGITLKSDHKRTANGDSTGASLQ